MADNATLPASGTVIATDEVNDGAGLRHFQIIKPAFGADGSATMVSPQNGLPVEVVGELLQAVEALRASIQQLASAQATQLPDVLGRSRVALETISGGLTLATVTTVTTVTTLSNQTNVGGFAAVDQIPALMRMAADSLRRSIIVT
jgi:hypothetical protein